MMYLISILFVWIYLLLFHGILCISMPRSCREVAASRNTSSTDDSYVIFLSNNVGVSIFCKGMQPGGTPQEYLTLPTGGSNNFAYFFEQVGRNDSCSLVYPPTTYDLGGRSEYSKIRIADLTTLSIQLSDYSYSVQLNATTPRDYGTAGDKYSYSASCPPRGNFKVDLRGTPFVVSSQVTWLWTGSYANSQPIGTGQITNTTYIGCFVDKDDRLLPAQSITSSLMTVEMCIQHCRGRGFAYSGVQYFSQCFCGDNHNKHAASPETECNTPCSGNSQQMCGGTWRISVYGTGLPQVIIGRCGGFPGQCFPTTPDSLTTPKLTLQLISTHPCLQPSSPCKNEGKCIALTDSAFRCLCYDQYSGSLCEIQTEQIVTMGSQCPPGLQPEKCTCVHSNCAGAKFDGDTCVTASGEPKVLCRNSDPGHVILFNVDGSGSVTCPSGTEMVGCSYWDSSGHQPGTGEADNVQYNTGTCSMRQWCQQCQLQARCKKYDCGCQNGGHCHKVTGECECKDGFYGNKCESFDYCSFYEKQNKQSACGAGGLCNAMPQNSIKTYGGDSVGDHCLFPFTYNGTSYGTCVESNEVGPPFSCGSLFDGTVEGYIDLGMWSPGPVYTMAAWVRPDKADSVRRTIVGGVGDCLDYGIYHFENFWVYYKGTDSACTRGIDTGVRIQTNHWYLVAVIHNGTHVISYVNGQQNSVKVNPNVLPTTSGLWIGGEVCCPTNRFKGMIKTVKIWKRPLLVAELEKSMNYQGNAQTTEEALHGGLVGQWELGEVIQPPCTGVDHGGEDWTLKDGQQISGTHCNLTSFTIPSGATVTVLPYNGTGGGKLEIIAQSIQIDGVLMAMGAGYRGGGSPLGGQSGTQGESPAGPGQQLLTDNRGGGGGGLGGNSRSDGAGEPGAGGGYGTLGEAPVKIRGDNAGLGKPGQVYGDGTLKQMFLGSGGGSGGSAKDLTSNPHGGKGGNGGGSISLKAFSSVTVNGLVSVSGEDGQGDSFAGTQCSGCPDSCSVKSLIGCHGNNNTACWDMSGPGGGGSGGSIYLSGKVVNVGQNLLWAMGGRGGFGTTQGCGGNGGKGRIRVDAVIFKGSVSALQGVFTQSTLDNRYVDHSQAGQLSIDYRQTTYGNEVYRGCFSDPDVTYRTLAYSLPLTDTHRNSMTPHYCMKICRDKGYQFSGTEYAYECYCDNHLRMDRKMIESDCQMPCQGDKNKICGGNFRLSVFGPPPGTPAFAHRGVTQKCEPWCLTADIDSVNPKWGQCSVKTHEVTSWQIVCQCPVGLQGLNCRQPCSQGTWGQDCSHNCTCNSNNTMLCDPVTGQCKCNPGYHGSQCNTPCPTGYYGIDCNGVCNCSKANSVCDPITGNCACNAGWMGNNCQYPCPQGHYGQDCVLQCACNLHGTCDPVSGTCQCNPGWMLPTCADECDPMLYGPDCLFYCNCNNQPCDPFTGQCRCNPGYTGQHCELECPIGFYGIGCQQQCQCSGKYGCDHVTGACHCGPGFIGQQCNVTCPPGSYGFNCAKRCSCYNYQPCDIVTGLCQCSLGYKGHQCEQRCSIGYYGANCTSPCQCMHGASCDGVTGNCLCPPGWKGSMCDVACSPNTGGAGCNTSCPQNCGSGFCSKATGSCMCTTPGTGCNCPIGYYGNTCQNQCNCIHGSCDLTGHCVCSPGWQGPQCNSPCPKGQFGINCVNTCACFHGDCDPQTGSCICYPGYSGTQCNTPCQGNTYGPGCFITCPPCGKYAQSKCDPVTGSCICLIGYSGTLCDQPCPQGYSGVNCSTQCNCLNGAVCRSTDGVCLCTDGYTGTHCELPCNKGTWGPNCSNTCNCGVHADGCDDSTGSCKCKPGFTGTACRESCPPMTYGDSCLQSCDCSQEGTSSCSPIDGTCQCKSGYYGKPCFDVCPYGRWGKNCVQTCECGSHGNCNPFNGQCSCLPGYIGNNCEKMCPTDQFYGQNCSQQCNCNGGQCDPVSGLCLCKPGTKGYHCEQKCGPTHFGIQCAQVCGCKNGALCDSVTGDCQCQPGWFGTFCDQSCPPGQYGVDCSQSCPDCQNGGSCDGSSGLCVCLPGFTGSLCNQTCNPGFWGIKCQNKCSATCQRGCQPQTGICNCSPGSCLNGGICTSSGICLCKDMFYGDGCQNSTGRLLLSNQSMSGSTYSISKGQLVGIIIGLLLLIVIVVLGVILIMKKKYTGQIFSSMFSKYSKDDTHTLEEIEEDGVRGFSNPLAENDKDNDNTVKPTGINSDVTGDNSDA